MLITSDLHDARVVENVLGGTVDLLDGVLAEANGGCVDSKHGTSVLCNVASALLAETTGNAALGWDIVADIGLTMESHILWLEGGRTDEWRATAATAQ